MGGLFPGKLFPAAPPRRENTRGQFARISASEKSLWSAQAWRNLGGRYRILSAPAAPGSRSRQDRCWFCPTRKAEAGYRSSGAADPEADSECGGTKEAAAF